MKKNQVDSSRLIIVKTAMYLFFVVIAARLFYWQVIKKSTLQSQAINQYQREYSTHFSRGRILTSDGYELVGNEQVYNLFVDPSSLEISNSVLVETLIPKVLNEYVEYSQATESAIRDEVEETIKQTWLSRTTDKNKKWALLKLNISNQVKEEIEQLNIAGVGFNPAQTRFYPEASMAAHITGFVGKDEAGQEVGYFGIEGALDQELKGKTVQTVTETDAIGLKLLLGKNTRNQELNGRDIVLTIRRDIQYQVEELLKAGIERYQAKSGEVVIMDPKTGNILAMASYPNYDQKLFYQFEPELYKNPVLANLYEPGSTLKALTVAIGLDTNSITPETKCPSCEGPVTIGDYTIRTWDNEYHKDITMTEALEKSDNTAMIYVAQQVGKDPFIQYLKDFGIGSEINLDLQEDEPTPFREERWGDIHLATASFGQGIVTNSLQVLRAIATIANGGEMMRPNLIEKVVEGASNREIVVEPVLEKRVISKETAQKTTQMLVSSAQHGEAKWISSQNDIVAGKTGTSQVVVDGEYDPEKTIASFVGFAPANDPKFVMIVKLVEPQSSPWAAETAAPLWYRIANKLFISLNITH